MSKLSVHRIDEEDKDFKFSSFRLSYYATSGLDVILKKKQCAPIQHCHLTLSGHIDA
jgi:hypothetical protein